MINTVVSKLVLYGSINTSFLPSTLTSFLSYFLFR